MRSACSPRGFWGIRTLPQGTPVRDAEGMSEQSGNLTPPADLGQILERIDRLQVHVDDRLDRLELAATDTAKMPASAPALPTGGPASIIPPAPGWTPPPPPPPPFAARTAPSSTVPTASAARFDITFDQILRWVGIGLVTLAGIFFVSTAISRGWIPPEAQLAAATAGGFALFGIAYRFGDRLRQWALPFALAGATVLAACAVASSAWLELISGEWALGASVAAAAISAGVGVKLRMEFVAMAAGALALVAPVAGEIVLESAQPVLASWVLSVLLGSAALGLWQQWSLVRIVVGWLSGAVFAGYAWITLVDTGEPIRSLTAYGVLGVVGAVLWFGPILVRALPNYAEQKHEFYRTEQLHPLDHRLVATVPAAFWLTLQGLTDQVGNTTRGFTGLLIATGFAFVADHLHVGKSKLMYLSQILGCSAAVAVALAFLLNGPALMVALTVQAVASAFIADRFNDWPMRLLAGLVGAGAASLAVLGIVDNLSGRSAPAGEALAQLFVVAVSASAVGMLFARKIRFAELAFPAVWGVAMAWAASVALPLGQGQALLSLVWALAAVIAVLVGIRFDERTVRTAGYATLAIVIGKLLTVDLAEVDVFWRVGLFLVVGVGLLRFAYVLPELAQRWKVVDSTSEQATPA